MLADIGRKFKWHTFYFSFSRGHWIKGTLKAFEDFKDKQKIT